MATNKNAQIRYLTLDRCFRNPGKDYTVSMLVEECNKALFEIDPESSGVKRRQLYDDISFMQDALGYDAPIEKRKDGRFMYYFYEDRDFSINKRPLNEQEAQQMKETLMTLSRFKGMPQFDWMDEMVTRLEQTFSLSTEEKVLSFDENIYLTGRDYIGQIYQAVINKQCLSIEYQSYNDDSPKTIIVHPYYIKEYNKRWFLFSLNDEYKSISNYPLDRIKSIALSKVTFIPNSTIDFEEYFEDVIGVSLNVAAPIETVLLKVDSSLFPYIKTKPLHGSQKIKEVNEEYAVIELKVKLNYELESVLLSFGEKIEVFQPMGLRAKFKAHFKLGLENYL